MPGLSSQHALLLLLKLKNAIIPNIKWKVCQSLREILGCCRMLTFSWMFFNWKHTELHWCQKKICEILSMESKYSPCRIFLTRCIRSIGTQVLTERRVKGTKRTVGARVGVSVWADDIIVTSTKSLVRLVGTKAARGHDLWGLMQ